MIREVIRPQQTDFHITIPNEYLNREIEFIMFPLDERQTVQTPEKSSIELLGGTLNKYADPIKRALEDNAWEMHVMEKYQ